MTRLANFVGRHAQVLALIALFAFASVILQDRFLSRLNLSAITFQYSVIGLIALGQFLVILTKGIDLSQGSIIAVCSMVTALAVRAYGLIPGILCTLCAGMVLGLVNGLIVAYTKIPAFVATLGMLGIGRGIALTVTNSRPVPVNNREFMGIASSRLFEVPSSFVFWLLMGLALAAFLSQWPFGRYLYAVGSNEENARLSGVPIRAVKVSAYSLSGLLCGIAGVTLTSRLGTGHPLAGTNYELESIAAVVIGGASLFGGIGRVSGVAAGVLILGVVNSIINLSGVSPYLQGGLKGLIILLAVSAGQWRATAARR